MDFIHVFEFGLQEFLDSGFQQLGVVIVFLYQILPQSLMMLPISGIIVRLLDEGFNVHILLVLMVLGKLAGQTLLYGTGMLAFRIFAKRSKDIAGAEHLLHKYRHLIFFFPVRFGIGGDFIMILAGHQRIEFIKILPALIIGNIFWIGIWLYSIALEIEIPDILKSVE